MIDTWVGAVRALSENADALLPGDSYKIDRDDGDPPSSSPDRGGPPSPPRERALDAATSPRRPARRQRAGGKRGISAPLRASLARERDDVQTGKRLAKGKAADQDPPPQGIKEE